jgi:hypothetical protein
VNIDTASAHAKVTVADDSLPAVNQLQLQRTAAKLEALVLDRVKQL